MKPNSTELGFLAVIPGFIKTRVNCDKEQKFAYRMKH